MKDEKMAKSPSFEEKCIVIRTRQETVERCGSLLYEAVRWCWRINIDRALKADYVLAVVNYGTSEFKVEAVFKPSKWYYIPAGECKNKKAPTCGRTVKPCGRIAFKGERASAKEEKKFLGKIIPMGTNPVKYLY